MSINPITELDPKDFIIVKGAKVNNLKSLDVAIPRNKLVVITGVSGSGKSSLAFDTLFAEGQRMYVESLSSYARQFLGRMEKPEVEYIKGICPAIAVEQKVNTKNPRSTVGTTTEIYDYLKLLYARIGKTYSPVSGKEVKQDSVTDVVNYTYDFEEGTKFMVLAPLKVKQERTIIQELKILLQKGYGRIVFEGETKYIEEFLDEHKRVSKKANIHVLIDRNTVKHDDEDNQFRISDSVQTAFFEGEGECILEVFRKGEEKIVKTFSDKFEADGITFEQPIVNFFAFNNPYGACRRCEGFGRVLGIDIDLVIPDKTMSVFEGAIAPWRTEQMKRDWLKPFLDESFNFDFPIHRPYKDLNEEQKKVLWTGNDHFKGIDDFFEHLQSRPDKIQYRVILSRYRGRTVCPDCLGTRLRKDASYVKIDNTSIIELVLLPIAKVKTFFDGLNIDEYDQKVARRILIEITHRLGYLEKVGLGYLTLNRLTSTLSGGEYQRIKLATSLGSALVGSMYILDEPSIGLHPRDTQNLIKVLQELKSMGNTVIVVEHEEEVMRAADQIIDIGPDAGEYGGNLVFQGDIFGQENKNVSHTSRYLNELENIILPTHRRKWNQFIEIRGAQENNLKNIDIKFPLNTITTVTGVSGSGKSTLIKKILYPALSKAIEGGGGETGKMDSIEGNVKSISHVEFVDQNPIGKSSRSNPVTYVKAYDAIRELYASQPLAKQRSYKPGFFSFNVNDGGRCELCQGEGTVKIEMQFMADIYLKCESCEGKRFKDETLDIQYKGKSIADVLDLSISEALDFFADSRKIADRLRPLEEVGLGYVRLGQSSNTLSGGEAQRVKLASFLVKGTIKSNEKVMFIFDEPTTGLHFHDIDKLLISINALVEKGHSVIIIEHNIEVIKSADWIIDLGPEGGENGGNVCFEGTPEEMVKLQDNHTARFLREKIN